MKKNKLVAGITMGDPAGIGPEVIIKALSEKKNSRLTNFLVIGNSQVLQKTARRCKIKWAVEKIKSENDLERIGTGGIGLLDIGNISKLVFGKANRSLGLAALDYIQTAVQLIKSKKIDVLITAPVNKHTVNQACLARSKLKRGQARCLFRGHTEYLAQATGSKDFAMMLVGGALKVTVVTRHIALKDVTKVLTQDKIYRAVRLTASALKSYFGISRPRIGVCGLNPHSGEEGITGTEESRIIRPAIKQAADLACVEGPLPADTLFFLAVQGRFDAVVAMYHDQGLVPLKMLAFHRGVNLTLGLPFVRTSPDHGTAYNIAGKNQANPGSMIAALKLAVMIGRRRMSKNISD